MLSRVQSFNTTAKKYLEQRSHPPVKRITWGKCCMDGVRHIEKTYDDWEKKNK